MIRTQSCALALALTAALPIFSRRSDADELRLQVRRITSGPKHHFFGYIGHVQNIPWNGSQRYIVGLRTGFQDRMPIPGEAADVVLIDTHNDYSVQVVEQTRAWNFQQGTMLYWNPSASETQFFFNDRDPETHHVFAVLYDIRAKRRIREFRYQDTPVANSGVAQNGGSFLGINYGRLARLRPVTGYPGAYDWTVGENSPTDDGVFRVNVATAEKELIVPFARLADLVRPTRPDIDNIALFINHTLWNRDDDKIYFFVRGDFSGRPTRVNIPITVRPDGTDLKMHPTHIGGHPEWEMGHRIIGRQGPRQVIYDVDTQKIVGQIGTPEIFRNPEGDIALSPDGKWFVNGHRENGANYYTVIRRSDGQFVRSKGFPHTGWTRGALRLDAAPCWNRNNNQILFTAIAEEDKTRQMFLMDVLSD